MGGGGGEIRGVLRYFTKTLAHCDRQNYVSYSICPFAPLYSNSAACC